MRDDSVATALAAAQDYLSFLARRQPDRSGPANPDLLAESPESERVGAALAGQSSVLLDAVAARLAAGLPGLADPLAAGLLACQVGGMVEQGADPLPLAEALCARLPADYAAALRFAELVQADSGKARPDRAGAAVLRRSGGKDALGWAAWAALELSTQAAMAVWCRHRVSRLAARAVPGLVEGAARLGARGAYCEYVAELLQAADGMQLTVLAPEQHKGFVVELEAVRNAAHLFVLLEDVLVGDPAEGRLVGPRSSPRLAALARGEPQQEQRGSLTIGWNYEYWWGLQPEAVVRAHGLHPQLAAMVGVEVKLDQLPEFRGQRLLLMRPARMAERRCSLGFLAPLHDALRCGVTLLRQLPATEVDALCDLLRAEAGQPG